MWAYKSFCRPTLCTSPNPTHCHVSTTRTESFTSHAGCHLKRGLKQLNCLFVFLSVCYTESALWFPLCFGVFSFVLQFKNKRKATVKSQISSRMKTPMSRCDATNRNFLWDPSNVLYWKMTCSPMTYSIKESCVKPTTMKLLAHVIKLLYLEHQSFTS